MATSTIQSISTPPIPIPGASGHRRTGSHPPPVAPSPASQRSGAATSSDSEDHDGSPNIAFSQTRQGISSSPSKALSSIAKDPNKVVLSGYLMKCGSKRHNWRKRWFVLNGEKLIYSGSHMVSFFYSQTCRDTKDKQDTKPHREFKFSQILDALEYELPPNRQLPPTPQTPFPNPPTYSHTFKIVTTKRTLLLCAPSEEEEIKWLSAIGALIARRKDQGVVPGEGAWTESGMRG